MRKLNYHLEDTKCYSILLFVFHSFIKKLTKYDKHRLHH